MLCNYDNNIDCGSRRTCNNVMPGLMALVGIIAGIVFTVVTLLLFNAGLLTLPYVGAAVMLGVGVAALITLLAAVITRGEHSRTVCAVRQNSGGLFFGIIGTILSGILAVSVFPFDLAAFTLIILGILSFCFAFMITAILFTVRSAVSE